MRNFSFNHTVSIAMLAKNMHLVNKENSCSARFLIILLLIFLSYFKGFAQLDTIHYLPPLYYTGQTNNDFDRQYVILSTFEASPFNVRIRTRDGSFDQVVSVSQSTPQQINLGQRFAATNLIGPSQKNTVLDDEGLIISGSKPFFVNITHKTSLQACIITSKGTVGLGKEFYAGFMASRMENNNNNNRRRAHFVSVIASENNTFVTIANPRVRWDNQASNTFTIALQAGQSYVVTKDFYNSGLNDVTINDLNGTKVTSNKPVSVISGSWTSAWDKGLRDIGLDQIVPIDIVGNEYIVLRGNGSNLVERVIIVSTGGTNNIYLNGSSSAYTTLSGEGDYVIIPESEYSANDNMYIETDNPVYVYQSLAGSNSNATTGMIFVPRLSCNVDKEVQISYADFLGNPEIKLVTQTGSTVTINGVTISGGQAVTGNSYWESYSVNQATLSGCNPGPDWNFTVQSTGALNAALTIESGAIGAGGYYSGFGTVPDISFNPILAQSGFCAGNAELTASGYATYNWYKDGSIVPGETGSVYQPTGPGRYKVVGVTTCAGQPSYTYPSAEVLILPCISVQPDSFSIMEGDIANPNANFNVTLSHIWNEDNVTFSYSTPTITASQGADYTSSSGNGTITAGNTVYPVSVPIANDLLAEDTESFNLRINNVVNAAIQTDSATAYILDDGDQKPTMNLESTKTVTETAGLVQFTVNLNRLSGQTIRTDYAITDISTLQTQDYTATNYSGTITFLPGETSKTISLTVIDDNIHEPGAAEQIQITLSNTVNVVDGNLTSSLNITDNETLPVLTINSVNASEGDTISIEGLLSHPSARNVRFRYYTQNGTATVADYTPVVLVSDTIYAGNLSFSLKIHTIDDAIMEGSEQFTLRVENLQNAQFAGGLNNTTITSVIFDNEGLPQITLQNASGIEGSVLKIPITISHPSSTPITFDFFTTANSATENTDYTGVNPAQNFSIAPNSLRDTISISSIEDTEEEGNEDFTVTLQNPSANAQFSDSTALVTIIDNDETPVANPDNFSTNEDSPYTDNIMTNDAGLGDTPVIISNYTLPLNGSISMNTSTGAFTYTPAANYNGADSIQYTIRDADGDESTATVRFTILPVNDLPMAVNDAFTLAENATLDTTVTHNDSGFGDGITINVVSSSLSGILTFNADGHFTYTPAGQFFGTESFSYEITDGNGDKSSASVQIQVNFSNDFNPVAVNDTISTPEDTQVAIDVLNNDYDSDSNATIDKGSVNIVTSASHGTTSINYTTGVITYTPATNYQGSDYLEYQISDADGLISNTARVLLTITAGNDVPVAVCNDTVNAFLDNSGSFTLTAPMINNGSFDADGDPLTFILSKSTFNCGNTGYQTVSMTVRDPLLAQSQCTSVINLRDTISPVVASIPSDIVIYSDGSNCGSLVNYTVPQFTDNCTGTQNGSLLAGYSSGSIFPIGTTTIKYSFTDPSGNGPVIDSFTVSVLDTISPVISCSSSKVFVNNLNTFQITGTSYDAIVTEICTYTLTQDLSGTASLNGQSLALGSNTINWTVSDGSGNSSNCTQTIEVFDSLKVSLLSSDDNDTACLGEVLVFTANSSGGMGALSYTFYVDDVPVSTGVSGNAYTTSTLTDMQEVKVVVSDPEGNSTESNVIATKLFRVPRLGPMYKVKTNW